MDHKGRLCRTGIIHRQGSLAALLPRTSAVETQLTGRYAHLQSDKLEPRAPRDEQLPNPPIKN